MLEHLTGDVEGEVGGVHHAPDKAEVVGQQVGALVHNKHAGGVELKALLILAGIEVVRGVGRDIEHGLVLHLAFAVDVDHSQGILPVAIVLLIEGVVLLRSHLALGPLPQRHHGVEGLPLVIILPFGLIVLTGVGGALLLAGLVHEHLDGVVDIVGVLLHQVVQAVLLQVLAVLLIVGIHLDVKYNIGAHAGLLRRLNGISIGALALPAPGLVRAVGLAGDGDLVGHHEGGVKAHTELTDDVHVGLLVLIHVLLELEGAAAGDGAQVLLQLLPGHANAVVADGQGAGNLVGREDNLEVGPVQPHLVVGEGLVGQFIDGVAGVGDDLTEENFLVGVD